jgi:copper chaperone CopZ
METLGDTTRELLRYDVDGMTCGHCVRAVDTEVRALAGVTDVQVDLDAALVTVTGTDLADQVVRAAILEAGYDSRLR